MGACKHFAMRPEGGQSVGTDLRYAFRRIRTNFPLLVIARPSGRGDRRECLWYNLLVKCSVLLDFSGVGPTLTFSASITSDCTGRLPRRFAPRNDIHCPTWSFFLWTLVNITKTQAPAKLPEPDFYARIQLLPSWKNATALAAATLRESTPWVMGILTV